VTKRAFEVDQPLPYAPLKLTRAPKALVFFALKLCHDPDFNHMYLQS
jgi:hypothetical protein